MTCFVISSGTLPTEGGRILEVLGRVASEDDDPQRSMAERVGEGHLEVSGLPSK